MTSSFVLKERRDARDPIDALEPVREIVRGTMERSEVAEFASGVIVANMFVG